jgi:hypothetical protein
MYIGGRLQGVLIKGMSNIEGLFLPKISPPLRFFDPQALTQVFLILFVSPHPYATTIAPSAKINAW